MDHAERFIFPPRPVLSPLLNRDRTGAVTEKIIIVTSGKRGFPKARIDIFSGYPVRAAERPPGKLSEREARVFSRQRSEQLQGRKNILSAEGFLFPAMRIPIFRI
jgi:hypothetical protein